MKRLDPDLEASIRQKMNPQFKNTQALIDEIDRLRHSVAIMHQFIVDELSEQYVRYLQYEGTTAWRIACQVITSKGFAMSAALSAEEILNDEELTQTIEFIGVNDGARTHDNRNHNPGLYQLSYAHHNDEFFAMARLAGLEPATLGLEGRCSIQLSYKRKSWSG